MGGHSSKQSIQTSTRLAASIVQSTAQSCLSESTGVNAVNVSGNFNEASGITQGISLSVNANCPVLVGQSNQFQAQLAAAVAQNLNSQSVALTQWMDGSRNDQASSIAQAVTTDFTQAVVHKCVSSLDGYNVVNVSGTGNVARDIVQQSALSVLGDCLQQNGQTNAVLGEITNAVNQHSQYTSENPLAFIPDAIEATLGSITRVAVVVFILALCAILVYLLLRRRRGAPAAAPGLSPAQRAVLAAALAAEQRGAGAAATQAPAQAAAAQAPAQAPAAAAAQAPAAPAQVSAQASAAPSFASSVGAALEALAARAAPSAPPAPAKAGLGNSLAAAASALASRGRSIAI